MGASPLYPSSFRTPALGVVATPDGSITVAAAMGRPRRLVLERIPNAELGGNVFLSLSTSELERNGMVTPGGAYTMSAGGPHVFTLGPEQILYAAGSVAGMRLSIAVNDALMASTREAYDPKLTEREMRSLSGVVMETVALSALDRVEIGSVAMFGKKPKRIVISPQLEGGNVALVAVEGNVRSDEYTIPTNGPRVFILERTQKMFVSVSAGVGSSVSAYVSEIPFGAVVGPTGIPGPDGQE